MELWYTEKHTENTHFSIKTDKQVYHAVSPFQQIDIFDTPDFGRLFTLDGIVMLTEKDEFIYHDMIVHVPMATNPDIKKVLVIGGGDGGTVRELCRYKSVEKIDMVEIDEMVVTAAKKYLPFTSCSYDDPRVTLRFEDGLKFIRSVENEYDLIIVDSTDPIGPGEGLFTKEFYGNCERALRENGILVNQHECPYYEFQTKAMQRSHKRIREFFPICRVYQLHIPTYPSGHWLFGFASKTIDPVKGAKLEHWNSLGIKTKYYNTEIHSACFALPTYVNELLEAATDN